MSCYIQDQNQDIYPLILPTQEICEHIQNNIPVDKILPWINRCTSAGGAYGLGALAQPLGTVQKNNIEIGVLNYPGFGASRWGYFCALISEHQLDLLSAGAFGDGTTQNAVTLRMAAEGQQSSEAIRVKMYVLNPYPLSRVPQTPNVNILTPTNTPATSFFNGLYLIILVDPRYYFQWLPALTIPPITIQTPKAVAWADVVNALITDMNITVNNIGSVVANMNYLYPDISLNLNGENAALVLDGVLANLGLRLVANLDGTFLINAFTDAQMIVTTDWNNAYTNGRTIHSGGQDDEDDFSSFIPKQLIMRNKTRLCSGFPSATAYPQYTSTTVQVTGNANYANLFRATGFTAGTLTIRDTCLAFLNTPMDRTPSNLMTITALAQQIFDDYCQWKILIYDIVWNGVANILPSGLEDWIIWTYREGECTTREKTCPLMGNDPGEMNHQDGGNLQNCVDSPSQFTDGAPGFLFLSADGKDVYNGLLIDNRIISVYVAPAPASS